MPVHFASHAAWSHLGIYVLTVEGDAFHAAAIEGLADAAARTLSIAEPAPAAPSDFARIGARLGQVGLVLLVLLVTVLAVLGARTRKMRS